SGTQQQGTTCVAVGGGLSCGTGTAQSGSSCVVNLGTVCGTDTTGAGTDHCVGTLMCGSNTTRTGSQCVGSGGGTVTCGSGTVLQGTQCVVAPATGPVSTFLQQSPLNIAAYTPASSTSYDRRLVITELTQGN